MFHSMLVNSLCLTTHTMLGVSPYKTSHLTYTARNQALLFQTHTLVSLLSLVLLGTQLPNSGHSEDSGHTGHPSSCPHCAVCSIRSYWTSPFTKCRGTVSRDACSPFPGHFHLHIACCQAMLDNVLLFPHRNS